MWFRSSQKRRPALSALVAAARRPRLEVLEDRTVPSLGANGIVLTDMSAGRDWIESIALQPDGKIVAAGKVYGATAAGAVARYNADGSLDASFNAGGALPGTVTAPGELYDVALQADGKILAAGTLNWDCPLRRYAADGSPDATFGVNGQVTTGFKKGGDDRIGAIAIQPDGKVVAVGLISGDWGVARYNPSGTLDT